MATVLLSEVIIPEVYMSYTSIDNPELTAFYESGVVVRNGLLDQLSNGGKIVDIPFWKDLDQTVEPNYATDLATDVATPNKITASEMRARNATLNQGYSSADLVAQLAGSDPMQHIRNRFGTYWTRQWQRRILAAAKGILADNIANDAADMVNDVSQETLVGLTDANLFSRNSFTDAVFTLGDAFGAVRTIAVHSIVYSRMVKNDDIEFIPDSMGKLTIPTFMGIRIVVDDGMTVVAGSTSGYKYTSLLFGEGAFGYGEGDPKVPVELYRRPDQGNGGGLEHLWERKIYLVHPFGFDWLEASVAGKGGPTLAELATVGNWNRITERKNIPIAALITNG
jgi:hypothetical protein